MDNYVKCTSVFFIGTRDGRLQKEGKKRRKDGQKRKKKEVWKKKGRKKKKGKKGLRILILRTGNIVTECNRFAHW
jgi:hypothetical protein